MHLDTFQLLLWIWIGLALVLFPVQLKITAPYGRHTDRSWGPLMDNRFGWILMEVVSPVCFLVLFLGGPVSRTLPMWIFAGLWTLHYVNRSLIFPMRTRTRGKRIPVLIVVSAICFNLVNGSTNGYYLGWLTEPYPNAWLTDPRFLIGISLFLAGAAINLWSDEILLRLRKPGEKGYKIPTGGPFRFLSCPNHFGEIVEWTGFAVMCWNLPALAFAIWTASNLIPRALSHHRWYKSSFAAYPAERKAVLPFLL